MMKTTVLRNIGFTIIGISVLGWLTACAESTAMMDKPMDAGMQGEMAPPMENMLMGSDGHHASGKVSIGTGMSNGYMLMLSDIDIDKVPDGYVYLTRNGDWMHGVELGRLKQFTGSVSFAIPNGIDPNEYDSVIIWCRQFNVEIGRAYIAEKMM